MADLSLCTTQELLEELERRHTGEREGIVMARTRAYAGDQFEHETFWQGHLIVCAGLAASLSYDINRDLFNRGSDPEREYERE